MGSGVSLVALLALGSGVALFAFFALGAGVSLVALFALGSGVTLVALLTLGSGITLVALFALGSGVTLVALFAFGSGVSLIALFTLGSGVSLVALLALGSGVSLIALLALLALGSIGTRLTGGFYSRISRSNPPVSVFPDIGAVHFRICRIAGNQRPTQDNSRQQGSQFPHPVFHGRFPPFTVRPLLIIFDYIRFFPPCL